MLGEGRDRVDEGVRLVHIRPTTIPKLGWLLNRLAIKREINRLVEEEGLDIVEAPDWCGLSAGIKTECPIVIRCNGSAAYFAEMNRESVSWSVRLAESIALKGAGAIASVSKFTADETARLFNLKDKIEIIPNCVPVSESSEHQSSPSEENRVLYFGTIVRKKGVFDLPEIIRIVCEENESARFVLMGRDAADSMTGTASTISLFQKALDEQWIDYVEYLGGKSADEVRGEIAKASICIFPSYAEALPLAWLEAMSIGKPVVAYEIGWASEVIESGVSGFLVPKGDKKAFAEAIQQLLSNPELRQ
jgi:glycosyltransferase involved in cell wall biosynthesis